MEEKVIAVFANASGVDASQITRDTRLAEDLEMNSLQKFALLALLEAQLGSAPDGDVADPWNTVGEWIDFYEN